MKQMLSALYGSDSSPYFIDEREQLAPDYSGSKGPSEGLNPGGPTPLCMAVAVPPCCMASHQMYSFWLRVPSRDFNIKDGYNLYTLKLTHFKCLFYV